MNSNKVKNTTDLIDSTDHTRKIFYQTMVSKNQEPKAQLIITHGLGEHSEAYSSLAYFLCCRLPIKIIMWDLVGHGRSSGPRGYVGDIQWFVEDLNRVIQETSVSKYSTFFMGHSLGGLILKQWEQTQFKKDDKVSGFIFSNPCFELKMKAPKWKTKGAQALKTIAPFLALDSGIKPSELSKDENYLKEFRKDHYRHTKISSRLFVGMMEWMNALKPFTSSTPVCALLSRKDPICLFEKSADFFHPNTQIVFDNSLHEIINDTEKEDAYHAILEFIDENM